jgi:hypothetical protein
LTSTSSTILGLGLRNVGHLFSFFISGFGESGGYLKTFGVLLFFVNLLTLGFFGMKP